ncbi:tetratricopeptide repeat protein [Bermanella sp. R86510]|uniref:tetratricopeptide repeat protein n=1 Tax=unclassified Bermanella TaxID=2627862 RepID=UPI0037CBA3D3
MRRILGMFTLILLWAPMWAQAVSDEQKQAQTQVERIDNLKAPLYNPFVERYVLDELKTLRTEMAAQKHELMQQILDREHKSVDRAVRYATDTVTYFFYLIAAATSILVVVGWTSIRDIKERVHSLADEEINRLIKEYEQRLRGVEKQLKQKTLDIQENRDEIELTQEIQNLWLKAAQESNIHQKVAVYDQILTVRPNDSEALTYKADAVLELPEPQWAINLCHQALNIDPENIHALYQLACAHASMDQFNEAVTYLTRVLESSESYREAILSDDALLPLQGFEPFDALMNPLSDGSDF